MMVPRPRKNLIPLPYRRVGVQNLNIAFDRKSLENYFIGKSAYMATDFVVLKNGSECAVIEIEKAGGEELFRKITAVEVVASGGCKYVNDAEIDTACRNKMAIAARKYGIGSGETLVVEGMYGHVNFLHAPDPILITLVDLIPPERSRLADLAEAAIAQHVDLPPIIFVAAHINISDLASRNPAPVHIFPCRASGLTGPGQTHYLDERPPEARGLLVGCERTERIYSHFYGNLPTRVETCPLKLIVEEKNLVLTRCCAFQNETSVNGNIAVVPWGCNKEQILEVIRQLISERTA